jgi:hypothetical protein
MLTRCDMKKLLEIMVSTKPNDYLSDAFAYYNNLKEE